MDRLSAGQVGPGAQLIRAKRPLRLISKLMPSAAGRRWLAETESFLCESSPDRRKAAIRNYFFTAPRVIATTWTDCTAANVGRLLAADDNPDFDPLVRALAFLVLLGSLVLIVWYIAITASGLNGLDVFSMVAVTAYMLSRVGLAALYRRPRDAEIEPTVAIIIPVYNEDPALLARTIHACLALDYPRSKIEIVVVNDGSCVDIWAGMSNGEFRCPPDAVRRIDFSHTVGKRAAVSAGARATSAEILVFLDSDSVPAASSVGKLVQAFGNRKVGAACGLTLASNANINFLTRMQQAQHYDSFQLLKAAESVLGTTTHNSEGFCAYRRSAILPLLQCWEHQMVLGRTWHLGAERSLTNMVLRKGWRSTYHAGAIASLLVPETCSHFLRMLIRSKRSSLREGLFMISHIWRTRPLACPVVLIEILARLSPIVMLYNILGQPFTNNITPILYILMLYMVTCAYGLLYRSQRHDGNWKWAIFGTFLFIALSPQYLWAAASIRPRIWPAPAVIQQRTEPGS